MGAFRLKGRDEVEPVDSKEEETERAQRYERFQTVPEDTPAPDRDAIRSDSATMNIVSEPLGKEMAGYR